MPAPPLLAVLTGPSGVGKDSVLAELKSLSLGYHFGVNATTRAPRPGEQEGVDYHFVTVADFHHMMEQGELLEHAMVYDQHKGVPKEPVRKALAAGKDVILRTDIQGARTIKSLVPSAVTIFIAPPSREELERRMSDRGGDSPEQTELRLRLAHEEMDAAAEFDHTVVNDDLSECVEEIERILERERSRPGRPAVRLD